MICWSSTMRSELAFSRHSLAFSHELAFSRCPHTHYSTSANGRAEQLTVTRTRRLNLFSFYFVAKVCTADCG
jgi:hypothetical protein